MKKLIAMITIFAVVISSFGMMSFAASTNPNVYNGNYSFKIVTSSASDSFSWRNTNASVKAYTDYVVTFWSKGTGNKLMRVLSSDWGTNLGEVQFAGGNDWKQGTFSFNSKSCTDIVLAIANNPGGGAGTVYCDNIVIAEKNDSSVVVLKEDFESGSAWGENNASFSVVYSGDGDEPENPSDGNDTPSNEPNYNVYEGYNSCKIINSSSDKFSYFGYAVKVKANTDYVMSVWAKGNGSPSMRVLTANWSSSVKEATIKGGKVWQQTTASFNSGTNTEVVFTFTNNPYGYAGNMYIDNAYLAAADAPDINLLTNPGFELDSKWKYTSIFVKETSPVKINIGDEIYEYEDNVIDQPAGNNAHNLYAGHKSLAYVASDEVKTVSQSVNLKTATDYIASFWIRSPEGLSIKFSVNDETGKTLAESDISATAKWVRREVPFSASSKGAVKYSFTSVPGQTGEIYIDYAVLVTKQRIKGTKTEILTSDISFENEDGSWEGIENTYGDGKGGFSLYIKDSGAVGDISGGVRVMAVGDSITVGVGSANMLGGYKKALYDKYTEYGADVNFVGPNTLDESKGFPGGSGHAGNSGWRIDQVEAQVQDWITLYEPQVVLLMIGTNDILQNTAEKPYAENAPARLESTVDKILAADSDIVLYLASIPPLNNSKNNAMVKTYNAEVAKIAEAKGGNVKYVDIFSAVPMSGIGSDYVHPNDSGYKHISDKWFEDTKNDIRAMKPSDFKADDGTAYDGIYSLRFNPYFVPYYTLMSYENYTKGPYTVEANTDYTFSMMVKGEQGVSVQARMQTSSSGGVITQPTVYAGPKWTKKEIKFNTGNNTTFVLSLFNTCMATGNMYIDCLELVKDGTTENLISNSSFENIVSGKPSGWSAPKYPMSFAVDMSGGFDKAVSVKQNGSPVTSLKEGVIDISADLTGLADDGAVLIAAVYEGSTLKYVDVCDKAVISSISVNIEEVTPRTMLKVFLFNSADDIVPLLEKPITR